MFCIISLLVLSSFAFGQETQEYDYTNDSLWIQFNAGDVDYVLKQDLLLINLHSTSFADVKPNIENYHDIEYLGVLGVNDSMNQWLRLFRNIKTFKASASSEFNFGASTGFIKAIKGWSDLECYGFDKCLFTASEFSSFIRSNPSLTSLNCSVIDELNIDAQEITSHYKSELRSLVVHVIDGVEHSQHSALYSEIGSLKQLKGLTICSGTSKFRQLRFMLGLSELKDFRLYAHDIKQTCFSDLSQLTQLNYLFLDLEKHSPMTPSFLGFNHDVCLQFFGFSIGSEQLQELKKLNPTVDFFNDCFD